MSKVAPIQVATAVDNTAARKARDEWRGKTAGVIEDRLKALAADQRKAVDQAGDDLDWSKAECLGGSTLQDRASAFVALHSEIAGITDALNERKAVEDVAARIRAGDESETGVEQSYRQAQAALPRGIVDPYGNDLQPAAPRDMGDVFLEAVNERYGPNGLKGLATRVKARATEVFDLNVGIRGEPQNASFLTSAGWPPFVERLPGYIPDAQRPIQVLDVIPQFGTDQHSIKYMEETTFTSEAKPKAEGAAFDESTLAYTERTVAIEDVGTHIPVSVQALEDAGQIRDILGMRLPFMCRQNADGQVMDGNGTSPNLSGYLTAANVQTEDQAGAANPTKPITVIRRAITKVFLTGRAMASHVFAHPDYWEAAAVSETTAGGFYLGSAVAGFARRIWGLPVVETDAGLKGAGNNDNWALVGDFMTFGRIAMRRDATVTVGYINDDFSKNLVRFKADMRLANVIYRPQAFCKIVRKA